MATKKLYLVGSGANTTPGILQETAPTEGLLVPTTSFTTSTTSAKAATGESANLRMHASAIVGSFTSHTTTPKPTGLVETSGYINFYKTAVPITGKTIPGDWVVSLRTSNGGNSVLADSTFFFQVYKGLTAATATLIPGSSGNTTEWITGGANIIMSFDATIPLAEVTFDNEHLFFALAVLLDPGESNTTNNRQINVRQGPDMFLETTELQPLGKTMIGWIGI